MGKKLNHSYGYELGKRGGNKEVMMSRKLIAAKFYQLKTGHELTAQYLCRTGKR